MKKLIKKFTIGQNYKIDFVETINDDGQFSQVEHTVKHKEPPHKDLYESISKIVDFYSLITNGDYTETINTTEVKNNLGRALGERVYRNWTEEFVDEDNGEVIAIDRKEVLADKGTLIDKDLADLIFNETTQSTIKLYQKDLGDLDSVLPISTSVTGLKSVEFKHQKLSDELESVKIQFYLSEECPLSTKGRNQHNTSEIQLDKHYASIIHSQIQVTLIGLLSELSKELLLYMEGKNCLPAQIAMFP